MPKFKRRGYRGIESTLPTPANEGRFLRLLRDSDLAYLPVVQLFEPTVDEQIASYERDLNRAAALGGVKVLVHGGRDAWPMGQAVNFFGRALDIQTKVGLPVAHETHRSRITFNPWATAEVLTAHPALTLCCDFSHYVCVCERLDWDAGDDGRALLDLFASRCIHVHSRVGHEQGPQVPDPAAPEYAPHLAAHERWWDVIWDTQQRRGDAVTTLTPEFGPAGYMPTLAYTQAPVADLERVCEWMADRQKGRFAKRAGA